MNEWLVPTFTTLIMYGLWGWFPKLAGNYLDPKSAWVWEAIAYAVFSAIIIIVLGIKPAFHPKGVLFASLTGISGALGTLFFFIAISKYKVSVVTTITALYPIITLILSFLVLREVITLKQGLGILLALVSLYFITS